MTTTTKRDLIEQVASSTSLPRGTVRNIVQAFLDGIIEQMKQGKRLEFRDFGVFEVRQRGPRVVRNPRTQEPVEVAPDCTVKFKAGRAMKRAVDQSIKNGRVSRNGVMAKSR